jgi:hypothetical protein
MIVVCDEHPAFDQDIVIDSDRVDSGNMARIVYLHPLTNLDTTGSDQAAAKRAPYEAVRTLDQHRAQQQAPSHVPPPASPPHAAASWETLYFGKRLPQGILARQYGLAVQRP